MATLLCYFSADPRACSPPVGGLLSIEADSTLDAICKLQVGGGLPLDWQSLWAHVLVWTADDGRQCGFESIRLSDVLALAS